MSVPGSITGGRFGMSPYPGRRFTVDEYHRMIQTGILTEHDSVELLEGWIVPKMSRNPPHDVAIELAEEAIRSVLPAGWRLRIQSAITTPDSEPEPDLAVVRGPARNRLAGHPEPADIALVVEVGDTTITLDRQDKGRLYARAGIACYWIVNLADWRVEVYTDPTGPGANPSYRQRQDYGPNDAVPLIIDGKDVGPMAVRVMLP